jgi:signal transduction histidine kinase
VTLLVLVQSLAMLRTTVQAGFNSALEHSEGIGTQVRNFLLDRLNEEAKQASPPPKTLEQTIRLWTGVLENDPAMSVLLEKMMAASHVAVEIQVCDELGRILASSSPARPRVTFRSVPDFAEAAVRTIWDRLYELFLQPKEYSTVVPLGVPERGERPIFTIRVIISSVLLRDGLYPQIRALAITSLVSLSAAIMLAVLVSNIVVRSLYKLGKRIDSITAGDFRPELDFSSRDVVEYAVVSSKLDILSEQFRGAKEDAMQLRDNVDQLLQSLEAAVMLFDAGHRLVLAGRAVERLLGKERQWMIGRYLDELFPSSTAFGAIIHEAIQRKMQFRDMPAVVERNGLPPVRVLASVELLRNYPGLHRLGTLVTLRDVESRRQLRSQLDVSSRLAAISRITGGVAHEIKNPLNAMALHVEILKAKLSEPGLVDSELHVIEREIARLDRVVKTFLDFTRPYEMKMGTVNLVGLLREILALVAPEAARVRVETSLKHWGPPALVRADRDLLKQAILNVVVNAIEAMGNGGELAISVVREQDDHVLAISDQGPGIPLKVRDKIFNLYFTTKPEGTGIGLAMTFRVVHLHNGSIEFTSEESKGTTFQMRFPAHDEAAPAGAQASDQPEPEETLQPS